VSRYRPFDEKSTRNRGHYRGRKSPRRFKCLAQRAIRPKSLILPIGKVAAKGTVMNQEDKTSGHLQRVEGGFSGQF
jgi:hypothetical protein